jgi:alpha-2-macroglobulin
MKRSFTVRLVCKLVLMAIACWAPLAGAADELAVYAYRYGPHEFGKKGLWAVMMRFNNPVFPSNVAQATKVSVEGVQKKFELLEPDSLEKANSAAATVLLVPTEASDEPVSVTITVSKGLSDAAGQRSLAKDFTYQLRSFEIVSIRGISTFYQSRNEKGLRVSLSSHVSKRDLANAVEVNPAVGKLSFSRNRGTDYVITGQFEFNKDYVLKISPRTVSRGAAIMEAKEFQFKGPGVKPEITVNSDRSVVELRSRQLLPLKLSNVTKVRCKIVKVPPLLASDVAEALATTEGARKFSIKDKAAEFKRLVESGKANPVFIGQASEDAVAFLTQDGKEQSYRYSLPLSFRQNPEQGGTWIVALTDPDHRSAELTRKLIQITDLSVSYKISSEMLLVWVTSIYDGQPVAGAEVLLVHSDGRRYFPGKTDKNGLLKIKNRDKAPAMEAGKFEDAAVATPVDLAQLTWIQAATPSDACGVRLNAVQLKPESVRQTSKISESPESRPNGHVFTERGVYKPGETVHFKFVSRVYRDKRIVPPAGEKVKIEVTGPRKDVNYSKELPLGEFGSCWDSLQTKAFFPVGTYTINVTAKKPDSGEQTFTNTFEVQEFKKVRHYAKITAKREEVDSKAYIGLKRTEEYLAVQIQGLYYTGGPVKLGRVRWKANLVSVTNTVKGLEGYFFGNEEDKTQFLESGESVLDGHGKLQLAIPLDPRLLTGINGVEISATVLDVDGEPATEVYTYKPKLPYLVGIRPHPRQVQAGYAAPLKVIVVDANGKRVPSGVVSASIMRGQDIDTEKRDEEGNISYSYDQAWRKIFSSQQSVQNGEAVFPLQFGEGGEYVISFTFEEKGRKYSSQTIFTVGWDDYRTWWRSDPDREEKSRTRKNEISVSMSKKEYAVGETVRIEFNTRRPVRKCLVTLERGQVLDAKVIDVNGTSGAYEFTVKEEHLPNVYISVLATVGREGFPVYASHADTDIPTVFFGYADVSVRSEVQKLRLDIEPAVAELKGRPAEQKKLSFRVTDHKGAGLVTEMAVCVVDEAVLALTGYKTPELSFLVKFNLPLSVFSGDLRLELISQDLFRMFTTKPLTGGGMGLGEVHPSLRKDFRPVAYFNPALMTDSSGRATIEFKLPDTTTAYRVFAVVCDKRSGFVSGQRNMVVTKEFFVEPSPPRFFCPGDKVVFPLVLHNKTAGKGVATIRATGSDIMRVEVLEPSRPMESYSGEVIKARAEIPGGMDQAVFQFQGKFEGDAGTFDDAVEMAMPIHSRFLPARRVKIGDFSQKTRIEIQLPEELKKVNLGDVNESDFRANLTLSMNNWSKIAPGLRYLLVYPYGCVEQTSSGVIPLAALRSLVKSGAVPGITVDQVDKFLTKGINRLLSMQVGSGGFGYWPGDVSPSWWGSMYAMSALTMAREAGFDIPEDRMAKAVSFLREGLFGKEWQKEPAWTKEYALYNLAANKGLTAQELEPFLREFASLGEESKALILLAANRIGALPSSKLVDMANKLHPKTDPTRIDYYHSSFREIALCLLAVSETKASDATAAELAGQLLRGIKPDGIWHSTADTGWCLLALAKYFQGKKTEKPATATVKMRYDGEKPVEIQVSDASAQIEVDARKLAKAGGIALESDSKHLITYTLSIIYPDLVNDPARLNKGFTLRKRVENLNGKEEIRVGDIVRVTLDVSLYDPTTTRYYQDGFEYLALEDPVPAGLVPINAALKTEGVGREEAGTDSDSESDSSYNGADFAPDFSEFRDDGVRVFKNEARSGTFHYSYLARAVAEGDFWMRGSRIALMYDPDVFGRTPGQIVKILPVEK